MSLIKFYNNRKKIILFGEFKSLYKTTINMSKQKHSNTKRGSLQTKTELKETARIVNVDAVTQDKNKNILIKILAKPGSKQNAITDISPEGIGVQINAPPSDGEANTELLKFIASVIGIRKGDISLEKGHRSRQKTVKVLGESITIEKVRANLEEEIIK